jgi:membrane associated rhomboid family serine protease
VPPEDFKVLLARATPRVFVTYALVAINAAVLIAMGAAGVSLLSPTAGELLGWGADFGPYTMRGEWWRLLTATFVHGGLLHLACNMYALWSAGLLLERLLGNAGFGATYVCSGLAGSLASLFWKPLVVSVGASGAVFGVYGALLGLMMRKRLSLPPRVAQGLGQGVLVFVGYNIVYGMTQARVDMAAHFGGLAAGLACGAALAHRLTPAEVRARNRRSLGVALGGAAVVVLGALLVPKSAARFFEHAEWLDAVERADQVALRDVLARGKAGQATDADLADLLESQVLPHYREARERFGGLGDLPGDLAGRRDRVSRYLELKIEAFELMVDAVRRQDASRMAAAAAKLQEANALTEEKEVPSREP